MTVRTRRKTVLFNKPFLLKSIGRMLPAGSYRVMTDEELIEGVSFAAYRRVATMIFIPVQSRPGSVEMATIDPGDLQAAQDAEGTAP